VVEKTTADIPSTWFKLTAVQDSLVIQAMGSGVCLSVWVPADVEVDGEVCVEAGVFIKVVRTFKSKVIELWTDEDRFMITGEGMVQKLRVKPVKAFPVFPDCVYQYSLPASVLGDGIGKVGFAVGRNRNFTGDVLNNLYIDGKGKYLNIVGSDGYRLAVFKVNIPFNQKIYINYKGLDILYELLKVGGEVRIGVVEDIKKFVCLSGDNFELAVQVFAEYDYPDYERVIPSGCYTLIEVYAEDLNKALNSFANYGVVVLELTESREGFKVRTMKNCGGEDLEAWVHGRVVGKDLTIAFKPKQLIQFLKGINHYIQIEFIDEQSPAVFVADKNYLFVVMPVLAEKEENSSLTSP
jgi:DNA polymerase-3 subunit beta